MWCPSEACGTREAVGAVVKSVIGCCTRAGVLLHVLLGEQEPDSARMEGSSIVDRPREC